MDTPTMQQNIRTALNEKCNTTCQTPYHHQKQYATKENGTNGRKQKNNKRMQTKNSPTLQPLEKPHSRNNTGRRNK